MAKSTVYFKSVTNGRDVTALQAQFKQLMKCSGLCEVFGRSDIVPIKMHFGEKGATGYVRAPVVKALVDRLKSKGAKPFVTDTNVLYHGLRTNAVDHLLLAQEHGFSPETLGCPVLIADGVFGENAQEIPLHLKHFQTASIARPFAAIASLVSIAHVTGHVLTGFAATIKNLGMGMASRAGKYRQHAGIKPQIIPGRCSRCGRCAQVCPVQAVVSAGDAVTIDSERCLGCAACVVACTAAAVRLDFSASADALQEKIVEYAYAALQPIRRRVFFNFAVRITRECDCMSKDEAALIPDVGIFAAADPVACDAACLSVVREQAADVFRAAYPEAGDFDAQLRYAEEVGLGTRAYELVRC